MAFQFTLEAVLRFRRALEAREEQRLAALLTRRATLLRSLEQSLHAGAQKKSDLQQFMSEAEIPMAEIQFVMAQLRAMERYRRSLRDLLAATATRDRAARLHCAGKHNAGGSFWNRCAKTNCGNTACANCGASNRASMSCISSGVCAPALVTICPVR